MERSSEYKQVSENKVHVLHPGTDLQKLPTFDIEAVNKMVQPKAPTSEPLPHIKKNVMRPSDSTIRRAIGAVTLAFAGLSAVAPAPAQAGDFNKSAEKLLEAIAIGAINSQIPGNVGLRKDPNGGDPVLVTRAPNQVFAVSMPDNVKRHMDQMGLRYSEYPFYIASRKYPEIDKLGSGPNTLKVAVSVAGEKAIYVDLQYLKDQGVWLQKIMSEVDDEGKMKSTLLADQLVR